MQHSAVRMVQHGAVRVMQHGAVRMVQHGAGPMVQHGAVRMVQHGAVRMVRHLGGGGGAAERTYPPWPLRPARGLPETPSAEARAGGRRQRREACPGRQPARRQSA
eukprot:175378-Chlamydomonas_euryale.AAC.2